MDTTQLLTTLVPVIVSGVVAIVTSKQVADLKEQLAENRARIAVLETILRDHDIPIPATAPQTDVT